METVSVIIVSWNARAFLRDCLLSIRKAGGLMILEVIVVDNASHDGSPDMVASEFPEVVLIRSSQNHGFARANNIGLRRATGSLFALINSDVVVHPNCFEQLAAHMAKDRLVGLVGPKIFGADGSVQTTCRELPRLWNMVCRVFALDSVLLLIRRYSSSLSRQPATAVSRDVEVLNGCFWLARRQAVAEVGGLDERFFFYAEDIDWCKRFNESGWKVQFVPAATATHFGGGSSSNAPLRFSVEMLRANITYWQKHGGDAGKCAFVLLSILHHALRLVPHGIVAGINGNSGDEAAHRFERDKLCLRWLLGRQIN